MKLDVILTVAPLIEKWYDQEVSVYVTDTEKFIFANNHPNLNLGISVGAPLEKYKASMTYKCLVTGQRLEAYVDRSHSIFGMGYVAICNPIIDEGQTVGVLTIDISTARYDALLLSGEEILAAVEEIAASADNLSASSQELAATSKDMEGSTTEVSSNLSFIESIVTEIKHVSTQSNILGINASIESARAGEHGRGFSVVAQEIRKLADNTNSSASNIKSNLQKVYDSVLTLVNSVGQLTAVSETQASGLMELTKALEQISKMAERLVEMGKKITIQ